MMCDASMGNFLTAMGFSLAAKQSVLGRRIVRLQAFSNTVTACQFVPGKVPPRANRSEADRDLRCGGSRDWSQRLDHAVRVNQMNAGPMLASHGLGVCEACRRNLRVSHSWGLSVRVPRTCADAPPPPSAALMGSS